MSATLEKIIYEITSDCTCRDCTSCGILYQGREEEECHECSAALIPSDYCYGCWRDAVDYAADYLFPEYLERMDNPKRLRIEGRAMGWQRRSGWVNVPADWERFFEALTINGDYRLKFTIEGDFFTVHRYSHDEPMGARFSVYPIQLLPDTMDLDEAIKLEIVDEWGCHKGCGEYFDNCECEGDSK